LNENGEKKMKKLPFILFIFIFVFVTSASATVYKWVDKNGAVNFSDDYSKVPPDYRNKVEEMNTAGTRSSTPPQAPSGKTIVSAVSPETAKTSPPIAQSLVREGDFAIKLAEALKIGTAKSEAEAESMLASAGITPKNGWIADYPMTPDIIGELEEAVAQAADAQKLAFGKDEALKALRTVAVEQELPIIAEGVEGPDQYGESPPPTTPEYTTPSEIDNYYYTEGPPIVTYYPPPWDYYYLYAWIPSPFWYSGFYFPGFFILHDFHRGIHGHGHHHVVTNHRRDHRTGSIYAVDPARRHSPRDFGGRDAPRMRGFNSTEARSGARSIFERSHGRSGSGNTSMSVSGRGANHTKPTYSRPGRVDGRTQVYNREGRSSGFSGRSGNERRSTATDRRMSRTPGEAGPQGMRDRNFGRRPESMSRQDRMNIQRPSVGETRSFGRSHSQGSQRSFGPSPQAGARHSGSPSRGTQGSSGGSQQGRGGGSGFGHGGPRF
jgi:hypothetical protein